MTSLPSPDRRRPVRAARGVSPELILRPPAPVHRYEEQPDGRVVWRPSSHDWPAVPGGES